jgi:heme exporter protein A
MNKLTLIQLTKAYGEYFGLIDVSTVIEGGQITALLGANGAGKSTLLSLLSSLSSATEGEIKWNGKAFDQIDPSQLRADIAYVGHAVMLYSGLSAIENLRFFAGLYREYQTYSQEALEHLLAQVGLLESKDKLVSTFSRGMLQRLTLARALLSRPKLLLLDEPFTGLDQQGVEMICQILKDYQKTGACIILSSHELAVIQRLANRVMILSHARLVCHQPFEGEEIYALYRRFVEGKSE